MPRHPSFHASGRRWSGASRPCAERVVERLRQERLGRDLVSHIQSLRRYARVLAGQPADADDLVQETLKRALLYCASGRRIDNLRGYLMTILHNVRRNQLIERARAGAIVDIEDQELASADASPAERLACLETIAAIRDLPDNQRAALMLVAIDGASYREAAEILGVPIGTVMSRLNRARAALKERLGFDDWFGADAA